MPIKSVPITLADGKLRHLRYDFNALCDLEDNLGIPISELGKKLTAKTVALKPIRAIVHAGLIHEDEELTIKEVGNLIGDIMQGDKLAELVKSIMEAMEASFGQPAGDKKNG